MLLLSMLWLKSQHMGLKIAEKVHLSAIYKLAMFQMAIARN